MSGVKRGPAHPVAYRTTDYYGRETTHVDGGMSLRDYFAAKALAGIADHFTVSDDETTKASQKVIARLCYDYADAMLAAR